MKALFLLLTIVGFIYAKDIAVVKALDGEVLAKIDGKVINLKSGDSLSEKMIIESRDESGITIVFKDNSFLVLGSNSIINLQKYVFKTTEKKYDFELFLKKGSASFESGKIGDLAPDSFIFKTPEGAVAIRGTKFLVNIR